MSYSLILDAQVAAYQPISERLVTAIRDNIRASAANTFALPVVDTTYTFIWPTDDLVWKDLYTIKVYVPDHLAVRGCRLYLQWWATKITGTPAISLRVNSPTDNGDEFLTLTDPYILLGSVDHDTTAAGLYSYVLQGKPALTGTNSQWQFKTLVGAMIQQDQKPSDWLW